MPTLSYAPPPPQALSSALTLYSLIAAILIPPLFLTFLYTLPVGLMPLPLPPSLLFKIHLESTLLLILPLTGLLSAALAAARAKPLRRLSLASLLANAIILYVLYPNPLPFLP